jgi:hypothetical protein
MPVSKDLKQFLSCLSNAEHVPRPDNEEWAAMIPRISTPGKIADIDEETYWYFLEVLPPKFMGGSCFPFAEGAEPLRFFWHSSEQYFCRQLTWDETKQFCSLAHIDLPW